MFSETVTGKFENIKTKATVLVIAKMNMKVHFNFFNFEYENLIVKMIVFIKVNKSSLVSWM